MGRQLRRVPLDFSAPLNKTWEGYINPWAAFDEGCTACGKTGQSPEARRFAAQWYGNAPFDPLDYGVPMVSRDHPSILRVARRNYSANQSFYCSVDEEVSRLFGHYKGQWCHHLNQQDVQALVDADRLPDFTNRPRNPEQEEQLRLQKEAGGSHFWLDESNGYTPTAEEVNDWSLEGFGHDSINSWVCVEARCKRVGVSPTCSVCAGSGSAWSIPAAQEECEAWGPKDPPKGPGYQLWETTTEGSPISPVFASLEELCAYAESACTVFGHQHVSKEKWKSMLDEDFVRHEEGNMVFM